MGAGDTSNSYLAASCQKRPEGFSFEYSKTGILLPAGFPAVPLIICSSLLLIVPWKLTVHKYLGGYLTIVGIIVVVIAIAAVFAFSYLTRSRRSALPLERRMRRMKVKPEQW